MLIDCDLVGGVEIYIPLIECEVTNYDQFTTIVRVPKDATGGRSITSPLEVVFSDPTRSGQMSNIGSAMQTSTFLQGAAAVLDAHSNIPVTSSARLSLIAENAIMIRDCELLPDSAYLRVQVANDDQLSNLQTRSYPAFAKLAVLGVKAYIYNFYTVELDMGQLIGGQQLSRVKEIIDGYADAEELYQTYLREKWTKIAFMNDDVTFKRFISGKFGGYR